METIEFDCTKDEIKLDCTKDELLNLLKLLCQRHRGRWLTPDGTEIRFLEKHPGIWELYGKPRGVPVYLDPVELSGKVIIRLFDRFGTKPADCFFEFIDWIKQEIQNTLTEKQIEITPKPPGRKSIPLYDKAFKLICDGKSEGEAFSWYWIEAQKIDKYLTEEYKSNERDKFDSAMNRRKKKLKEKRNRTK